MCQTQKGRRLKGLNNANPFKQGGVKATYKTQILLYEKQIIRRYKPEGMKQSFETKITIRIYDTAFARAVDEKYMESGERFESKNHFLVSLIRIGLERYILEEKAKSKGMCATDADKALLEVKTLLDELIRYSRKQSEISNAHHEVCEKLANSILTVVLALSQDEDVDKQAVEDGAFEALADRLEQIILRAKFK